MSRGIPNFFDDPDKAYLVLLKTFRYLDTCDLLSAGRVSKVWNLVASDNIFWKTVTLDDHLVRDYTQFGEMLRNRGTQVLNWKEQPMLQFFNGTRDRSKFISALKDIKTLTKITISQYSPKIVKKIAEVAPQITSLEISFIDCLHVIDLSPLSIITDLTEFKLKNAGFINMCVCFGNEENDGTGSCFEYLNNLTTLSLTGVSYINDLNYLPPSLVSLDLGSCHSLSEQFPDMLSTLVNLKRLRLEEMLDRRFNQILEAISSLPNLSELELINFEIGKKAFISSMAKCSNLKSLLILLPFKNEECHSIVPSRNTIVKGVSALKESLDYFVWGYYIWGYSIYFLSRTCFSDNPDRWRSIPALERKMSTVMPTTYIKVLKFR